MVLERSCLASGVSMDGLLFVVAWCVFGCESLSNSMQESIQRAAKASESIGRSFLRLGSIGLGRVRRFMRKGPLKAAFFDHRT